MSRFAERAKENQKKGCKVMEGRDKIAIEDIITDYPDFITVDEVGYIPDENGDMIAVLHFVEGENYFFFGGKVLKELVDDWVTTFGDGDPEKCTEELKKDGGCKLQLFRKKAKKGGKVYTGYNVVD